MSFPNDARYTVVFVFTEDKSRVLLIRKTRPKWQAGLLNGIGGKIEPRESPEECARREVKEEAGIDLPNLQLFCRLHDTAEYVFEVYFYRAFVPYELWNNVQTLTDESVIAFPVAAVYEGRHIIPNLRWLIPMALGMDEETAKSFDVAEIYPKGPPHDLAVEKGHQ